MEQKEYKTNVTNRTELEEEDWSNHVNIHFKWLPKES